MNTCFLGLFDTTKTLFDGIKKTHPISYKSISGLNQYFPLFHENLLKRKNWKSLNHSFANTYPEIDFCITNSFKINAKSNIHFRLILDVDTHYISDKSAFYEFFKDYEFIPLYQKYKLENQKLNPMYNNIDLNDEYVILKPDLGCLGMNIRIIRYSEIESLRFESRYENWTISRIYIPRLYCNTVVTNRLYFLIVKERDTIKSYLFDEFVNYKAIKPFSNIENYNEELITNYTPQNYYESDFFNNRYVSHCNYVNIFTKTEFQELKTKINKYLSCITLKIAPHLLTSNNNDHAFHLYGIDIIIDDLLNVKILEINGAPSINNRSLSYPNTECMNYYILINELLKIVVDEKFKPWSLPVYSINNIGKYKNSQYKEKLFDCKFELIESVKLSPPNKKVYISKSIAAKYPFILNGFFNEQRSFFYQRTKNPHLSNIDVFYGLRDLYVNNYTSENYYNEVVEFNGGECFRKCRVINKIQGVTYYLANKERLYKKLTTCYSEDQIKFHSPSVCITIDDEKMCSRSMKNNIDIIKKFISTFPIIIKPSNGSQGKGIEVLFPPLNVYQIISHLLKIKNETGYFSFIISEYIDNVYLYMIGDKGYKFNIRFYVLLKLEKDKLSCYILNQAVIYFALLEYNATRDKLSEKYQKLSDEDIEKSYSLTNLQMLYRIREKYSISLSERDVLYLLKDLFRDSKFIWNQFRNILNKTLNATRNEFRPLNRFINTTPISFNILAYDTLLDSENLLHLIEVNRGADLVGLQVLMNHKIVSIFEEVFDICVDGKETDFDFFEEFNIL
jgi:hypothetical protein